MELKITLVDGRWLVNGKRIGEMPEQEQNFLNKFFEELKAGKNSQLHVCEILKNHN